MGMGMLGKIGFAFGLLLLALPALGADVAILHNGFSIHHEWRETIGPMTRLYLGADKTGYVDLASDQINVLREKSRRFRYRRLRCRRNLRP
jgi:hypothetical protein